MRTTLVSVLFLSLFISIKAQVSVFDCNTFEQELNQQELDANAWFYGTCYTIGDNQDIRIPNTTHKLISASDRITLKKNTHIGKSTDLKGKTHIKLSKQSALDVVVMNYPDLNNVLRYKKLEFGIRLPSEIHERVLQFINPNVSPPEQLNPFMEWDLDVEMTFHKMGGGWSETIDGFFTREYKQNFETHDWDDQYTEYPFRIRYAPRFNGKWIANVKIKVKGTVAYQSNNFIFNVVESGDPGYVHTHENGKNLKRGDRMIFPIGQNFISPGENNVPWAGAGYFQINETLYGDSIMHFTPLYIDSVLTIDTTYIVDTIFYGNNLFSYTNTEKAANIVAWNNYLEMIEQYLQMEDGGGSKYFRTLQTPYSSLIEFEEKGNYYNRLHYAAETDKILDLCEKYDALFQFNLLVQEPIMKYGNYNNWLWDWDHYLEGDTLPDPNVSGEDWSYNYPVYCYNDDPSYMNADSTIHHGKKAYEMFINKSDLAYHKQRTRYYIARYGYSTKIYEFEILSEPWHINESWSSGQANQSGSNPFENTSHPEHDLVRNAIYNYHKEISTYIKDSLNHINHLIGIDMAAGLGDNQGGLDKSITLPSIDIVGFNPYYTNPNALLISDNNYMNKYLRKIWSLRKGNIPVIIPEGGTAESNAKCSNYAMAPVDKMKLPFIGIAGYNSWPGYTPFKFTHENDNVTMAPHIYDMWKTTIRVKNHMNGDDVIGTLSDTWGAWKHGMGKAERKGLLRKKYAVEQQNYISSNKKMAVGYVYNRTYNVKTRGIGSPCSNINMGPEYNTPRNTEWNYVKNSEQLRVTNLKTHTKYRIYWYSAFRAGDGYLKSDCIETNKKNGNWGITLRYPELTVSHNGSNDLPAAWFVMYKEDCEVSKSLVNTGLDSLSKEEALQLDDNLKPLSVFPNPFQNYISIQSPQTDQMVIKSIEGKIIGIYNIEGGLTKINSSFFNDGMYIITFMNQNKTFKIIKQ